MYGLLWRALPGPRAVKALQAVLLALVVVAVCFLWVFPAVAPHLPFNDNTVAAHTTVPAPDTLTTPAK